MSFFDTFSQMLGLFFAVAMGYLANKLGYLNEDINRKLSKVVLNITLPCMILSSVMTGEAPPDLATMLSVSKMLVVFYAVGGLFALVLPRFLGGTDRQKGVWKYALMFPNTVYVGYPVIRAMFGPEAIFYGVVLNIPFNLLAFSLGPIMLGGKGRFSWRALVTPTLITSGISLAVVLLGIRIPALPGEVLSMVGDATVPVALMMLGSVLAGMSIGRVLAQPRMWLLTLFRLVVVPLVVLAALRPLGLSAVITGVAVMESATPVGVSGVMLCMEYDGDIELMAQSIFVTTLLSVVTIPLVAMLL